MLGPEDGPPAYVIPGFFASLGPVLTRTVLGSDSYVVGSLALFILAAAAAGLTGERVLEMLREHCSGEIPGNVAFEISAWSSQYRQISIRPALLIQCPDEATSDRVVEAAGSRVMRLTATMLELQDTKAQGALVRKLREAGIFSRS